MNVIEFLFLNNSLCIKINSDIDDGEVTKLIKKVKCISNLYKSLSISLEINDENTGLKIKNYLLNDNPCYQIQIHS